MRLRTAEPADAGAITRLINTAFQVERFFIEGDRISAADVHAFLDKGQFILAENSDRLAGCVYLELRGDRSYIGLLAVDPARQRNGIGSVLMKAAEVRSWEAGCSFADLRIVNLREELPAFYLRLGYHETGTSPFPADTKTKVPCHFVDMSKALARGQGHAG